MTTDRKTIEIADRDETRAVPESRPEIHKAKPVPHYNLDAICQRLIRRTNEALNYLARK